MYTVLIQSKNTMDIFLQFYPLMADAVEAGNIGVCQWVESGRSVETALPELYGLIEQKNAWRAIIVCASPIDASEKYPTDQANPYDYLENEHRTGLTIENGELVDCEAPIIRLTHLLGGIPSPEPQFKDDIEYEEGKIPRIVFRKVQEDCDADELQRKAYLDWTDAHVFQGPPPTEIILVTARKDSGPNDTWSSVGSAWKVHTEAESSEFWKRNLYPHNCRFLVFSLDQHGVMRQQRDYFKLWTAMMLIASNDIDPNVLQAHRLYGLSLSLNQGMLEESMQNAVNKLNKGRYQLEKSIKKEEAKNLTELPEIPDFEIGVPVSFKLPHVADINFDASEYALTGGEGSADSTTWNNYTAKAIEELQMLIHSLERTLDQSADRLRNRCKYSEADISQLTAYQEEDMQASLDEIYCRLLHEQEALPSSGVEISKRVEDADKKAREEIHRRMNSNQAFGIIFTAAMLILLSLLPAITQGSSRLTLLITAVAGILFVVLAGVLLLHTQRKAMYDAMTEFQAVSRSSLSELSHDASLYSAFFSSVATHIHGKSYLELNKQKRAKRDSSFFFKQKHIKAIDIFLSKLAVWSAALHVNVDMKSVEAIEFVEDGVEEIDFDKLYGFDIGKSFSVPINRTGMYIISPFGFVERLEIEREEIYDNAELS